MKYISILNFVLFFCFEASASTITCSSFIGARVFSDTNSIEVWDDKYSNQSIILHLNPDNNKASVEWVGANNFTAPIIPLFGSQSEGWMMFVHPHREVFRTYQYHYLTQNLALTESQARLIVGGPEIKTFIGNCSP